MSYTDDEELKIGDPDILEDDAEADLDLDGGLDDPLMDDDLLSEDVDEEDDGTDFAGLDGSSEY